MTREGMTPEEYGIALARSLPPITEEQVEETARILASVILERRLAAGDA